MYIKIANYIIKIKYEDDVDLMKRFENYLISPCEKCDMEMEIIKDSDIEFSKSNLYGPYKNWYYCKEADGSLSTLSIVREIDKAIIKSTVKPDGKKCQIRVWDISDIVKTNVTFTDKLFVSIGISLIPAVLKNNGFVMHGSAISYNGNGIVFSAKSGTGKSTQTSLWKKCFDQTILVNDDTPLITFEKDDIILNGTPFAGTTGLNTNISVPLKAVVFIRRAKSDSVRKLSFTEAVGFFMDEMKKTLVSENIDECFNYIVRLMGKVNVYLLDCTKTENAVYTLKEELGI